MNKLNILIIAIIALIFIGIISSRRYQPVTTTKTLVIRDIPPHHFRERRYGYVPHPPHYNPYKAQYY